MPSSRTNFLSPAFFVAIAIGVIATLVFAPNIHSGGAVTTLLSGIAIGLPIAFMREFFRLISWAMSGVSTGHFETPDASASHRPADRCARCGYSRAGVTSPHCPECDEDHRGAWAAPLVTRALAARIAAMTLGLCIGAFSCTGFLWADLTSFRREAARHFASGATGPYVRPRWSNGSDAFIQLSPSSQVLNME